MNESGAGVHSTDGPEAATYRAGLYRLTFAAAALYNMAFGLWAALWPQGFFTIFELDSPRYPAIWACLGMVIGLYGSDMRTRPGASIALRRSSPSASQASCSGRRVGSRR